MSDKKPQIEFKTNIPEKFIFVKMFKQGENTFKGKVSKYFACSVNQDNNEKVLFATEALWNKLQAVTEGDTCQITKAEIHTDDGNKHLEWQVLINGVEQGVSKTKAIADAEEAKNEYHEKKNDKWDEIAWSKCKYGFLLEAYKSGTELSEAEPEAEQWANASTRRLEKPLFDEGGNPK